MWRRPSSASNRLSPSCSRNCRSPVLIARPFAASDANRERRGAGDRVGKGHIARSTCSVQPDTYLCLGISRSQPCIAAVGSSCPETFALEPLQCCALQSLQAFPRLYAFEFQKHAIGHAAKQRQAADHAVDAGQPFDHTGKVPRPILGIRGWYGDANSTPSPQPERRGHDPRHFLHRWAMDADAAGLRGNESRSCEAGVVLSAALRGP